jgi:hypothetical protein
MAKEDNHIGDTVKQTAETAKSPDRPLAEESCSSIKARKGKVVTTSAQDPEEDPAVAEVKQKKAALGLNTTGDTAQCSQLPSGSKVAGAKVLSTPTGTKRNLHSDSGKMAMKKGMSMTDGMGERRRLQ